MTTPQPVGYVVYRERESSIPSILADAVPDGGGTIYIRSAAEDRLAELSRHGLDDYRMAALVPVEGEPEVEWAIRFTQAGRETIELCFDEHDAARRARSRNGTDPDYAAAVVRRPVVPWMTVGCARG